LPFLFSFYLILLIFSPCFFSFFPFFFFFFLPSPCS
jgi:hypothetical protein